MALRWDQIDTMRNALVDRLESHHETLPRLLTKYETPATLVIAFLDRAHTLGRRWRATMEELRPEPPCELAKLDLRRLFKGYVKYLKLPGPPEGFG